jgi:hypothetical protein
MGVRIIRLRTYVYSRPRRAALRRNHFGSRDGLYEAVLIEAHRRLVHFADLQQLIRAPLPAADKLRLQSAKGWHLTVLAREYARPPKGMKRRRVRRTAPAALS